MNLLTDKIDEQIFIDALKVCGIVNSSENPRNNQVVIGKQTVQRFNPNIRDTYIIEKIGENRQNKNISQGYLIKNVQISLVLCRNDTYSKGLSNLSIENQNLKNGNNYIDCVKDLENIANKLSNLKLITDNYTIDNIFPYSAPELIQAEQGGFMFSQSYYMTVSYKVAKN